MQKAFAIAAVAASLGLASLPGYAMGSLAKNQTTPVSAHVQAVAAGQDQQAGQRNDGKKCWYVLDVLLCE